MTKIVESDLIIHRGASMFAPENTISSLKKAIDMGAKWIETDVRLTKDNKLIIIHDSTLERTTNGYGDIVNNTLKELKSFDAGSWFASKYKNERIPTLEEYISIVIRNNINLQLELKEVSGREYELANAVAGVINSLWPDPKKNLLISSFSERCLKLIKKYLDKTPQALATSFVPNDPKSLIKETGVKIIQVQDKYVDNKSLDIIKNSNIEFGVATVNDTKRAKFLLKNGIQSIITDNPNLLK